MLCLMLQDWLKLPWQGHPVSVTDHDCASFGWFGGRVDGWFVCVVAPFLRTAAQGFHSFQVSSCPQARLVVDMGGRVSVSRWSIDGQFAICECGSTVRLALRDTRCDAGG